MGGDGQLLINFTWPYSLSYNIITNAPIITYYRSIFTFLRVALQDNSTGIVINITILHDENTLLMLGVHILGEVHFHYISFVFLWNRILDHQINVPNSLINK